MQRSPRPTGTLENCRALGPQQKPGLLKHDSRGSSNLNEPETFFAVPQQSSCELRHLYLLSPKDMDP